jgi:hypothetical protein
MTRYSAGSRKRQATHAKLRAEVEAMRHAREAMQKAREAIPIRPIHVQEKPDAYVRND